MIARVHIILCLGLLAGGVLFGAAMYDQMPDPAPTHWNLRGEVDGYGPRWVAAFLLPLICVGLLALLWVLPVIGPFRQNFEQFRTTYGRICVTVVTLMIAMHAVFVLAAAGRPLSVGPSLSIILGVMLAVLGNWMSKVRRNFYVGIRTPWTLANEQVWERTHRAGAKVMVAVGALVAAAGFVGNDLACFVVLMGGLGFLVVWAVVYSLVLYRRLGGRDDMSTPSDA